MRNATIRACGAAVAIGGVLWGTTGLIAPPVDGTVRAAEVWSSGAFLVGAIALVAVVRGTRAVGDGRWGGGVVVAELVALTLAALSTAITRSAPGSTS